MAGSVTATADSVRRLISDNAAMTLLRADLLPVSAAILGTILDNSPVTMDVAEFLEHPQSTVTSSRLATVTGLLRRLARSTVPSQEARLADLRSRRHALDAEIARVEAGRTFTAFHELLTDIEASTALDESVDEILDRPWSHGFSQHDREFLRGLLGVLQDDSEEVRRVMSGSSTSSRRAVDDHVLTTRFTRLRAARSRTPRPVPAGPDPAGELGHLQRLLRHRRPPQGRPHHRSLRIWEVLPAGRRRRGDGPAALARLQHGRPAERPGEPFA